MKKKISALIKTAGITSAVLGGAGYFVFNSVTNRNAGFVEKLSRFFDKNADKPEIKEVDERELWFNEQTFEEYEITNEKGLKLRGYFLPSDTPSDVYVFCSHGYRANGKGEFRLMTKFYHDKGYNVFLVDHQASGESEGKYIGFGYHEYKDCLKWLDFIIRKFGKNIQIILHGVSMGSATVTMMSGCDTLPENVKFIVADCGYTTAYDEISNTVKNLHIPLFPFMNIANTFSKKFAGYDFKKANPLESVKKSKVPMLFIHGAEDDFVPVNMVFLLYNACSSTDKDLLIVEGATHANSYQTNSSSYEQKVFEFSEKHINK